MVTVVRKEYRKPYVVSMGGYQDMMRTTWDKSVWNSILESDPRWAEFLFVRAELPEAATAAEARRLKYVKQSEFKKHYLSGLDYQDMEYLWTGYIPGAWPPGPGFPSSGGSGGPGKIDAPWDLPNDLPIPDDGAPSHYLCDSDSDGCYCPGSSQEVTITATHPIVSVQFVFGEGETITDAQPSWGYNTVTITIAAPENRSGQMRLRVWMQLPTGRLCESENNIYECSKEECCDCSEFEYDWGSSQETLVPPGSANVFVTGGESPYTWSITSEDGKWSLQECCTDGTGNVVDAEVGACGSATITITDSCGCETEGSIRNPNDGSWVEICRTPDPCPCVVGVANILPWAGRPGNNWTASGATGKYKQDEFAGLTQCDIWDYETVGDCEEAAVSRTTCDRGAGGEGYNEGICAGQCDICMSLPATLAGGADCAFNTKIQSAKCFFKTACYNQGSEENQNWISCRNCFLYNGRIAYEWMC